MFSKKEIELFHKIIPDQKFLQSKDGLDVAQKGYDEAAKEADKY
ncbi:hypothetical protein [Acetilactobacillus jinshanensis]|nr:hypothetical protein [Acetilactobacillus jinshanensis]